MCSTSTAIVGDEKDNDCDGSRDEDICITEYGVYYTGQYLVYTAKSVKVSVLCHTTTEPNFSTPFHELLTISFSKMPHCVCFLATLCEGNKETAINIQDSAAHGTVSKLSIKEALGCPYLVKIFKKNYVTVWVRKGKRYYDIGLVSAVLL